MRIKYSMPFVAVSALALSSAASAELNTTIEQTGSWQDAEVSAHKDSDVTISQRGGDSNQATLNAADTSWANDVEADISQYGDGNVANITRLSGMGGEVDVAQEGTNNEFRANADGTSGAVDYDIEQRGNSHYADVDALGTETTAGVDVSVRQVDGDDSSLSVDGGWVGSLDVNQEGSWHDVQIESGAESANVHVDQHGGDSNSASITTYAD